MKPKSYAGQTIRRKDTFKYTLLLEGIIVGAVSGLVIACFRMLLNAADKVRNNLGDWATAGGTGRFFILMAVLFSIAVLVSMLLEWEPECSGSGIPQVEGELKGRIDMNWLRVIAAKLAGCTLAIGGGLALGREGPSVQIGAMVGKGFSRTRHRLLTEERLLITCGAGAGLSAAFGAPLAGAIFALEELHKTFSALVLITTMASAAVSDWIASTLIGRDPVFNVSVEHILPLRYYWAVIILGILLGLLGVFYNKTLTTMQDFFGRVGKLLPDKFSRFGRMISIFAVSLLMFYVYPTALGSGGGLVAAICEGNYALGALAVMLLIKFIYSTGSFGSGAPGGIFLPLLVLGAICGGLVSRLLTAGLDVSEEYIVSFVIIGMAGLFAAIVRAPATGIILITEMTGSFSSLLALVTVSLTAYVVADLLGGEPVYDMLWSRRAEASDNEGSGRDTLPDRKTIIEGDVHLSSEIEGHTVQELELPAGCLIVAVIRDGAEKIPNGRTKLKAGDHLEILCRQSDIAEAEHVLNAKCMNIRD